MGIAGLLPFLKNCLYAASVKDYRGCTVAIDSYCWLHKGAFSCAEKLANGEKTDQYVYYCLKFVNMLLSYDIKPIMVFDGCRLPSKRDVEKQRRERREMYRKKAAQLLREGKKAEARDCLTKCVDITPQMALELIKACRAKGVDCIVAPYEADAQLAYLSMTGIAQIIITEDSDLILFGCEKVLFKMDPAGNGMMLNRCDLGKAMDMRADCYSFDKFRHMCILSGCDYLASLPGIGLKKAQKLFQRTRQTDIRLVLKKIPSMLNMNLVVSTEYIEGYVRAVNTFLYQLVYDPTQRKLLPLNPYPEELDIRDLNYAGPTMSQEKALQIALGNTDIYTGKPMDDFDPDEFVPKYKAKDKDGFLHRLSIWDRGYRPRPKQNIEPRSQGVERKSTAGTVHTAKIPHNIRTAPVKRPLEPDVSDTDLATLYGGDGDKPAKKQCVHSDSEEEDREDDVNKKSENSPRRSLPIPNFLDVMNPSNRDQIKTSPKHTPSPALPTHPELPVASPSPPSKNPFRRGSLGKKRFTLNQQKTHVVSRFFNSSEPLEKTSFGEKLGQECEKPTEKRKPAWVATDEDEVEEVEERIKEEEMEEGIKEEEIERIMLDEEIEIKIEPELKQATNSNNSSPYCMFNKLSHFKSKFDPSIKNSPASRSKFKPVLKASSSQDAAEKYCASSQDSSFDVVCDTSTLSQRSSIGLNSIDTDSIELSPPEKMSYKPALPELPQQSDCDYKPSVIKSKSSSSFFYPKQTTASLSSSSSQPVMKKTSPKAADKPSNVSSTATKTGSCRRAGLSQKSPKGGATKENNSIKNFLVGFKRNTGAVERLPSHKALSPKNT